MNYCEEIEKHITCYDVLRHFNIPFDNDRMPCPIHKGKGNNFSLFDDGRVFTCFSHGCGEGLNRGAITLYCLLKYNTAFKQLESNQKYEALKTLCGISGVELEQIDRVNWKQQKTITYKDVGLSVMLMAKQQGLSTEQVLDGLNDIAEGVKAGKSTTEGSGNAEPDEAKEVKFPRRLLNVPGFMREVMDYTMATAAIPNEITALAGAIALQSMLAGRKVTFHAEAETRTNLYIITLAGSTTGKNPPRNTNIDILKAASDAARDTAESELIQKRIKGHFASQQGIVKSVSASPSILFQTDEVDKLLQSLSGSKRDSRALGVERMIMEMYSSSTSTFYGDARADEDNNIVIEQPNMCILGSSTPGVFYESLSFDALRNGFVGRILPIESKAVKKRLTLREKLGKQTKKPELPKSIIDTAWFWVKDNRDVLYPQPKEVTCTNKAVDILDAAGDMAHTEYMKAFKENGCDCPECAIWGRFNENRNKLALIYACSENHENPTIGVDAARWGSDLVEYSCRLLIKAISENVADTQCHRLALRIKKKIAQVAAKNPDGWAIHGAVKLSFGNNKREFDEAIELLEEREEIEIEAVTTARGSDTKRYRITK